MSVPLSTIKNALKINYDDDDTDLIRYRIAATEVVEKRTGRNLSVKPEILYLSAFADCAIPAVPFVGATSVTYTATDGTASTLSSSLYWIDYTVGPIPYIRFLAGCPSIKDGTAIAFNYNAGHDGAPEPLVHCIIALVGGWYNNPEAFQVVGLSQVPLSVEFIMSMYDARNMIR